MTDAKRIRVKGGTYRSIASVLLDLPKYRELPQLSRHILLTLLTSRINNLSGVFLLDEGAVVTLAAQVGTDQTSLIEALKGLESGGWLESEGQVCWVVGQLERDPHVWQSNPKHRSAIATIFAGLPPTKSVVKRFCDKYGLQCPDNHLGDETESEGCPPQDDKKTERRRKVTPEQKAIYQRIISDLNKKTGRQYTIRSTRTISLINARLKEGFTPEDFEKVHTVKAKDWGRDPHMSKYLRPETLYSPKHFESYVNQVGIPGNESEFSRKGEQTMDAADNALGSDIDVPFPTEGE